MNESLVQKRVGIQGLTTAILLPSVDLFGDSIGRRREAVGPLTSVVGIGLFQRAILTLQRGGIRQLIVLAGPEEEQLKQSLCNGPRVTIPVRWMPVREFPLDDPRTWEFLGAEVGDCALVLSANAVFSRGLIEHLRQEARDGEAMVVAQATSRSSKAVTSGGVRLRTRAERLTSFAPAHFDDSAPSAAEMAVLPAGLMSAARDAGTENGRLPIRRWLERAAVEGRVRVMKKLGVPYKNEIGQAESLARAQAAEIARQIGRASCRERV